MQNALGGTAGRALWGASAVLAVVLGLEWTGSLGGDEPAPVPEAQHKVAASQPQDEDTRDTADWVDTVLARPLFSVSRKPAKPDAAATIAGAGMPRLAGILVTPQGRRAIFAPEAGGKPLVVAEGGNVDDVKIVSIRPDRVILASGATLQPAYDKLRIPSAQPALTPQPFVPQPFTPQQPNFTQPFQPGGPQGFQGRPFPRAIVPDPPAQPATAGDEEPDAADAPAATPGQPNPQDTQTVPAQPIRPGVPPGTQRRE